MALIAIKEVHLIAKRGEKKSREFAKFHISMNHRIMVQRSPCFINKVLLGVHSSNTPLITSVGPTLNIGKVSYLNFPRLNL